MAQQGNWNSGPADINGVTSVNSVSGNDIGYADPLGVTESGSCNLKRACRWLIFTAGITDESDPSTKARFRVSGDGKRRAEFDVPSGARQHRAIRVGKVLRLQLSVTNLTHVDMTAAYGGARVRCTKRPG